MYSENIKNGSGSVKKIHNLTPEENHSNYASARSSPIPPIPPIPNRSYTVEEPSNVSDIIPSIIAKTVVSRETIDYRDMGVEITSFAHPAKSHEYDQTIQYSQNDLTILSTSTVAETPSIIIDKGDVTHFVANVVEDEQVDFTKLRRMLKDQEKKGYPSSIDASNILGDLAEPSTPIRSISQEETVTEKDKMESEIKVIEEVEDTEKEIDQTNQQLNLELISQELDQIREENEQIKNHSDNLRKEINLLQEKNEHLKIDSDNFLKELNQLREENKYLNDIQELERLREENKRLKLKLDNRNDSKSLELESMREENERLKLELHAYKRNTRPLSKSPSGTKESKTAETRRNIFRDKLYFKLQLTKVDELEAETLSDLVKEIMLILKIDDVNQVVPSLEQINKVIRLVPQLRDFIRTVILLVLDDNEEINRDFSSRMLPQDIPPENMLKTTIEVLAQWRETVKNMEMFAAQLLQNSRRNA